MKLKKLTVVADPIPEDKGAYFDHVGTPQERPKYIQGSGSDSRLETSILLECPACHKDSHHEGRSGWADMWTWGLSGHLDKILSNVARNLQSNDVAYRCPHCGSISTLDDASIEMFCDKVRDAVGNLPKKGAEWALQAYRGFMVMHNWGLPGFQYRIIHKNLSPNIIVNGWLLDKCGCIDHCQRLVAVGR